MRSRRAVYLSPLHALPFLPSQLPYQLCRSPMFTIFTILPFSPYAPLQFYHCSFYHIPPIPVLELYLIGAVFWFNIFPVRHLSRSPVLPFYHWRAYCLRSCDIFIALSPYRFYRPAPFHVLPFLQFRRSFARDIYPIAYAVFLLIYSLTRCAGLPFFTSVAPYAALPFFHFTTHRLYRF